MVCISQGMLPGGVALTNPNLQVTNPNLQESASMVLSPGDQNKGSYPRYPDVVEAKETWLRPPFGTQHQVSKLPL